MTNKGPAVDLSPRPAPLIYQNQPNKHQKRKGNTNISVNRTPRFIKIPKATKEWQQVSRKPKLSKKEIIQCFYCRKKGHIQKFCWQRINCFSCGKRGHKFSNCPFKAPTASSDPHRNTPKHFYREQQPKHSSKEKQQPSTQLDNLTMEPIYGRPPLRDTFSPSRQTLSEDNEYLCRVGLIILIRGAPSHDLPHIVADHLVAVHGGRPSDFLVTHATISPLLVTCRNSHIRDTVVRTGLYTIPQSQVQFVVHEWRPRFGMGFDPSTHQVWVKIVGLPLQVWTTTEISAFLRNFGHPMQILPFGHTAGHFTDITALVATKSPSRIPLAYAYCEGEYATRVEIIILNWRPWSESYFPPPTDNRFTQCPQCQQQNHAGPSNPQRRSPSSSASSAAPSEPTIDLSAWSPTPRSNRVRSCTNCSSQPVEKAQLLGSQHHQKEAFTHSLLDNHHHRETPTHGGAHVSATPDPNLLKSPAQLSLLLYACLTVVPNPIAINPLRSL